ncbi:hypothetical protein CBF34_05390 [Vagococcus penaei]|uniref:Uncharacterized protein n=1 Tax=Vagococcus penaei TaxID=633807 RepID=A0A1Q2D652_9ENTE|nr:hypothetical protein BW732_06395 [Vagococcus penaei]RSU02956.1 hypothetical protein CBF34_05390 [Vagococcus penaei]
MQTKIIEKSAKILLINMSHDACMDNMTTFSEMIPQKILALFYTTQPDITKNYRLNLNLIEKTIRFPNISILKQFI